ncbi:NAD-dependent epimerase/dehydratase family protein [Pseudogemmobacter humi]|uniref:NAD dependent epimerase/dehydratase family protein n=1 Tax=Pseudogemmobacter humi TaxID=2483812 RepID=A0A3P5WWV2_9RHOB|nr:NAD-dependent epimerase/dehydratase family protein [Pseudogemmobacter humi]VDC23531.1 NAD dependent epimerase/dehydratase family protein [Pseudogemmobacter humi]
MLRRIWRAAPPPGLAPLWAGRGPEPDLTWDILTGPAPSWPPGAVLLHLAGSTGRTDPALNTALVPPLLAACRANAVRHLLFASTAAVYAPGARPARETDPAAPANAYGRAKAEAESLLAEAAPGLTVLRIGNVAGADALLGPRPDEGAIRLDPVPGSETGPLRSWIGPVSLARCLAALILRADDLPAVLNVAAAPPLGMADLLRASDRAWSWGPVNPAVVPAAVLDTTRLNAIAPPPPASPGGIMAELAALKDLPA